MTDQNRVEADQQIKQTAVVSDENAPKERVQKKTTKQKKEMLPKPLLEPCGNKCRRKCKENIDEDRRRSINKQYWEHDHERRGDWILKGVRENSVKRRTVE